MICRFFSLPVNLLVTLLLWGYFTLGFVLSFVVYCMFRIYQLGFGEVLFQRYFSYFFRGFFALTRFLSPRLSIEIDPKIREIRASVIVSNHQSYLDPLLLVSLFAKQKTIVKNSFFKVPVFSWIMRRTGYIPAASVGKSMALVMRQLMQMEDYLNGGGNLFVFPEGTRSRDGKLNDFNTGAFNIARKCHAPIVLLYIENTNILFKPGSFLFNTLRKNKIRVELLETFILDEKDPLDLQEIKKNVIVTLESRMNLKSNKTEVC